MLNLLRALFVVLLTHATLFGQLAVDIKEMNADAVPRYEKLELTLQLDQVCYSNPFNPNEIDVTAFFTSPSDSLWPVFAFYDNYRLANAWKVRFAPNEIGLWHVTIRAINQGDTAWSPEYTFRVDSSQYHGWIRVSRKNPHYFEHDDGTPFYGIGAYYPWGVHNGSSGLELLQNSGANIFGYWNIMYGDEKGILESLDSGIGHYDQTKCGRIDQIVQWAEERNLKIMIAIWPHDLLSNTVWAHQWHNNPYKYVCNVEDFYSDAEAWQYQQWQYRYWIARWGYSRALAIWEIVNEINGTDGWQKGRQQEATEWVRKVQQFFNQNDPHGRPCTASQSGGIYWSEGYQIVDVPNVHLYETSWSAPFPGNPLRSSAQLYYDIARRLHEEFDKPGILGEAGYLDTFGGFEVPSEEYTQLYHNALWAGWAGGYAATPFWWSFASRNIMSLDVMSQMKAFSKVARSIDHTAQRFTHFQQTQNNVDLYVLKSPQLILGWAREANSRPLNGRVAHIPGVSEQDTVFGVTFFNTWQGTVIGAQYVPTAHGTLTFVFPDDGQSNPDQAFLMEPIAYGQQASRIRLFMAQKELFAADTSQRQVFAYIQDEQGRVVRGNQPIQFQLEGPGRLLGQNPASPQNGMASILYQPDGGYGEAHLCAKAEGLISDTLIIRLEQKIWLDHFEDYASSLALNSSWQVRGGTTAQLSLQTTDAPEGQQAMRVDYAIGDGHAYYAGFFKSTDGLFPGGDVLSFWLKDDQSGRNLTLLLKDTSGQAFQYNLILNHSDWQLIQIPFSDFGTTDLESGALSEVSFNILAGDGGNGSGWLLLDALSVQASSTGQPSTKVAVPQSFCLFAPFPNPFNQQTRVRWNQLRAGKIQLALFNILGEKCAMLAEGPFPAGRHSMLFDAGTLASGIYFLRLQYNQKVRVQKLVLIK